MLIELNRAEIESILDERPNADALLKLLTALVESYDPSFGDDKLCTCGDPYYRHFDTYEDMEPVGCKYAGRCGCEGFQLAGEGE